MNKGFQSCRETFIYGEKEKNNTESSNTSTTIICSARLSCSFATLIGIDNIYALGKHSIEGATVYSNGNSNQVQVLNVYNAVGVDFAFDIYCLGNDTCNLYCDYVTGCSNARMHCYPGTNCSIACYFDGLLVDANLHDCPDVTMYNQTDKISVPPIPTVSGAITSATSTTGTTGTTQPDMTLATDETTTNTIHQSTVSSQRMTTTTSVSNQKTEFENSDNNNEVNAELAQLIKSWEIAGYLCLFGSLFTPIILCLIAVLYHEMQNEKYFGCDKVNYLSIFSLFFMFGDFYSDLIFGVILALSNYYLWYFALFFSLIPHFMSNFIGLYNISKWQKYNIYIGKYLNKYETLMITVSCFGGFYCSIELLQSKLFYLNMFGLQLKYDDYNQIKNSQLFNIVIFELSFYIFLHNNAIYL